MLPDTTVLCAPRPLHRCVLRSHLRPQYLWDHVGLHSVLGGRCWVQQVPQSQALGLAGWCWPPVCLPAGMMYAPAGS